MAISFGGLATGLDTNSIVTQLMNVERAPIVRMEADKTWLNNRLSAFTDFDSRLKSFLSSAEALGNLDSYGQKIVTTSSQEFFLASASDDAQTGLSYQIEVEAMATVQKSYTETGFNSDTELNFGTGDLLVNVGGTDHTISITAENNSLQGIMQAINDADIGVGTSIINDGLTDPYHLTFTGTDVGTAFSIDDSGLTGGTESLGTININQVAAQAHVIVDGIDIYSDSNTIEDAIPGLTLTLLKAEAGTTTTANVKENNNSISANLNAFIKGYNEVVSFVTGQSTLGDTSSGVLAGDSGLNTIKRHLQDMLTTLTNNSGSFTALTHLGLETQKDGTLTLNSTTLNDAIETDLDSVISLVAGIEDGDGGLGADFTGYLESLTDSTDGLLAGRSESITSNIARIDTRIESSTLRLEKREELIRSKFNAMEQMVSLLNAQSDFLTQQMDFLGNLSKK